VESQTSQRMIGDIYRNLARLAKMNFEERRKLVSTFLSGKDTQNHRLEVYLERDRKTEAVRHEIRGAFDQTFQGEVTSDGVDLQDFKDVARRRSGDVDAFGAFMILTLYPDLPTYG
jgi:hypothetical protein